MTTFSQELLAGFLEEAGELVARIENSLRGLQQADEASAEILWVEVRRRLHTLKGASAAVGRNEIVTFVHDLETRFAEAKRPEPALIEPGFEGVEALRRLLGDAIPTPSVTANPAARTEESAKSSAPQADELLRIRPERIDALHNMTGELTLLRLQYDALTSRLVGLRENLKELHQTARKGGAGAVGHAAIQKQLIETTALCRESGLMQTQTAALVTALSTGIQELRLMPVEGFFTQFNAIVREAARSIGKQVRLEVRTTGVELDRSVLLRLRESIIHLVRNAVVHGIEYPDVRRALGKDETGVILLDASYEGATAHLRIIDDGAGVDIAKVRAKAVRLGIPVDNLEEGDQLLQLLLREGFTTRDSADDLSGRGVGLDVVGAGIAALDGNLWMDSMPGAGTIFTLSVPVRAATSRGIVLQTGGQLFAVLAQNVDRILRTSADELLSVEGATTLAVYGRRVGIVDLCDVLGLPATAASGQKRPAILLRHGKRELAIAVDDILGEQPMVIKSLGPAFAKAASFLGGAIGADGSVLPVLDAPSIMDLAARTVRKTSLPEQAAPRRARTVLVADDSITMRMLQRNILQAAGYSVTVAQDGKAALQALAEMDTCDLLITDLQMPELDGMGLCKAVRQSPTPNLPIIMVTSVDSAEEKERATMAGADAYIVKQDFEQRAFLQLVARLAGNTVAV
jgi:two-component system, chemotaxis family, sensor kinase CheA